MEAISRRVGADALIEGSAALANGRVRLTVRLVHGATDRQLWSSTYERTLSDVLTLQGELARAVADAVQAIVTGDEHKAFAGRRSVDPDAYMLYLRAGHFFNLRGADNVRKSIAYYEQAIARDRMFAAAYGRMALSYCLLIGSLPPEEAYRPVKAAAAQALALDPMQVDAQVALSQATFLGDRNWREARRELESVLQRYPNHATAHLWYASVLTEVGPLEEALAERRRALTLEPLANATTKSLGEVLDQMGRYGEAVTAFKNTLELDPSYADGHGWLGFVYLQMGRRDEGIAELEASVRLSRDDIPNVARLAHAYGLVGRRADAQRLLTTLIERSRREWVSPKSFAHVYAGLGDLDQALAKLEEAYRVGTPTLMRLKSDPLLDPLKGDPRFADLVRRLNLPWP
jgi:tetratricopeptide (TPR) repeat protein